MEALTQGVPNTTSPTAPIGPANGTSMLPDTNRVVPQYGERNYDGHRFAAFGVLPDRWKTVGYSHPLGLTTSNPATYLVVNDQTASGSDWLWWSTTADLVGATSDQKWGAEVGWHTNETVDINVAANFSCVSPGAEQPGASTADLNQIKNALRQRALLGPVR